MRPEKLRRCSAFPLPPRFLAAPARGRRIYYFKKASVGGFSPAPAFLMWRLLRLRQICQRLKHREVVLELPFGLLQHR
ncbi:MAG TPA: hypothetical protein PK770_04170, partial [Kiritimatiellia bacterium]|nr:hypothetical protein [Kiritimatiellia bacterium]